MKLFIVLFSVWMSVFSVAAKCQGKFINPITDICWKCLFPMSLSGFTVIGDKDDNTPSTLVCLCPGLKIGLPITYWEPTRMIDITRTPYCMVSLTGTTFGPSSFKNHGTVMPSNHGGLRSSYYHAHWYIYPVLDWLKLFTDFSCTEKETYDIGYMTEFDPLWNDDELAMILEPESILFANPIAQMACVADCTSATLGKNPQDNLFWCAGCQGSIYPFTGTVVAHVGAVQASYLILQRMIAKLHRMRLMTAVDVNNNPWCEKCMAPLMTKALYKTHLVFPSSPSRCEPLGRSDVIWGAGKSFPYGGEDFAYLVWTKNFCCLAKRPDQYFR